MSTPLLNDRLRLSRDSLHRARWRVEWFDGSCWVVLHIGSFPHRTAALRAALAFQEQKRMIAGRVGP